MAEETQYTAKNGIVAIATANPNLDGSGTLGSVITGASNGTLIKNIFIKATGSTTEGMIRLFLFDGVSNNTIIKEIEVPAITPSGVTQSFETVLNVNMTLQSGQTLKASTQNANTFNVIAEAVDWAYYASNVRMDTTLFTTVNGQVAMTTANPNLDGAGTIYDAYTAGSSATYKGSSVKNVVFKHANIVTDGMIRLYINNGTASYLFKEMFVAYKVGTDITQGLEIVVDFEDDFELQAGYKITGSTQNAELDGNPGIDVCTNGNDWKYLA